MEIRTATVSDLNDLVRLNNQVQQLHAQLYPMEFKYPTDADDVGLFFKKVLASDDNCILLLIRDDIACAYIYYEIQQKPPNAFKNGLNRLYVHHVAVDASYRRVGIATALFEHIEAYVREENITDIALDTYALNKEAHQFFKNKGLSEERLALSKRIS